jgi:1,4-dihydroxy-6-naphthoate synthase
MGEGYGPIVVSREPLPPGAVRGRKIAVPGLMTTAFLALKLFQSDFEPVVIPFDKIIPAVLDGKADAGLLIHEGQLTYAHEGLHKVVDLGEWWHELTRLPLPLGGNAIRRDLGRDAMTKVAHLLKASIRYALENRKEALEYALRYARDLDKAQADRFVAMYVNARTLDYGDEGRRAVALLLERAHGAGIIPARVPVDFVA